MDTHTAIIRLTDAGIDQGHASAMVSKMRPPEPGAGRGVRVWCSGRGVSLLLSLFKLALHLFVANQVFVLVCVHTRLRPRVRPYPPG